MNDPRNSPSKRVVLVERDERGGLVLERALADCGWTVTRIESGRAFAAWQDPDVVLLVLDDDDTDIFEMLIRLSSSANRPTVVLLTRRADARALGDAVLDSLGIDHVIAWPCRVEQLTAALDTAHDSHESMRWVS